MVSLPAPTLIEPTMLASKSPQKCLPVVDAKQPAPPSPPSSSSSSSSATLHQEDHHHRKLQQQIVELKEQMTTNNQLHEQKLRQNEEPSVLEAQLVECKLALAQARGAREQIVLRYRLLEKEFVQLKLLLARTKQSEDDSLYLVEQIQRQTSSSSSNSSPIEPLEINGDGGVKSSKRSDRSSGRSSTPRKKSFSGSGVFKKFFFKQKNKK